MVKTRKLSLKGRIIITALIVVLLGALAYITGIGSKILTFAKNDISSVFSKDDSQDKQYEKAAEIKKEDGAINISLDEWIG